MEGRRDEVVKEENEESEENEENEENEEEQKRRRKREIDEKTNVHTNREANWQVDKWKNKCSDS